MMRVLALDIGERRLGLALSDGLCSLASPYKVLDMSDLARIKRELRDIVEEYEIATVVVGLPLSLDGEEGPQARRTRTLAARLLEGLELETIYHDERLSSKEAKHSLRQSGYSDRQARGTVDKVAAALFLQAWLDARRAPGSTGE